MRREILALEADPRSPERGQYAFVQALIREVAYNTLARGDRKVRHLAAARFFESLGTDELAGALAGHYLAAHANAAAGPEADALAGQARIALRAAGERASSLGAHDQALGFYEQALSITTDQTEEARLHTEAAAAAKSVGRVEDADRHYRAALEHHRAIGDRSAQAATIAGLGEALLTAYRMEPALELLAGASTELSDLGDDAALIRLRGQLARAYFFNDEDARAVEIADGVLQAAERLDLVAVVADALITRGSALTVLGRRYEGLGAIEAGCRLAADHGFLRTQVRGLINLCSLSIDDDPRAALAAIREGLAIAERLGERSFQLFDNAFTAALAIGDWDPLEGLLEPILGLEARSLRAVAASDLATLRAFRGEPVGELLAQLQALPEVEGDDGQGDAAGLGEHGHGLRRRRLRHRPRTRPRICTGVHPGGGGGVRAGGPLRPRPARCRRRARGPGPEPAVHPARPCHRFRTDAASAPASPRSRAVRTRRWPASVRHSWSSATWAWSGTKRSARSTSRRCSIPTTPRSARRSSGRGGSSSACGRPPSSPDSTASRLRRRRRRSSRPLLGGSSNRYGLVMA